MGPFLNVSNHPVADWSQAQRAGALALGSALVDVPFPHVDPAADDREIANLGAELVTSVLAHAPAAVMVQGEHTLTFVVVAGLQRAGIDCYVATTTRDARVEVEPDAQVKTSRFVFARWRRYPRLFTGS